VQDLGRKVQPRQRLQDRAGEKRILLTLGLAAAINAVAEIKLVVHEVNDDAVEQQPLDADVLVPPAEVNIKIRQMRDLRCVLFLDHAVVRRDDACVKAERGQTFRQRADNICKAAGLGQRRALGGCQQHAGEVAAAFFGQRCAQFGFHSVSPLPVCEGEVYGGKLRQRHARRAGERAEGHVLAADLGRVVHAGAAEFLAVARQQLAQYAALGQADDKIVIAHGREVAHAHEIALVLLG